MKTINYLLLSVIFFTLLACKKEEEKKGAFAATTYQSLGTYDSTGKPNYLLARDTLSAPLLSFVSTTLPDKVDLRTTQPQLFTTSAVADVAITQSSDVFITYVSQDGQASSTFAFYTYPTTQPPTTTKDIGQITYVFPNAGNKTPLQAGDKVKIGRFEAGTSIGFVLLRRSWDNSTQTVNNQVVHFCSNDALNPEADPTLKKHAVLIPYTAEDKVLIGFEDLDRTNASCDHDFNDVVVFCTVRPLE